MRVICCALLLLQVTAVAAAKRTTPTPTAELLDRARARYDTMDFDEILPLVNEVLAREEVAAEHQVEAYRLQAIALAVMNRTVEAEAAFRLLLRVSPDYELPEGSSPMVSALFSKVQLEERAIRDRIEQHERAKLVAEMAIEGAPPEEVEGGSPVQIEFAVRDPRRAVESVQLRYRRKGDPDYSALALSIDERGLWTGIIPAETTENEEGLVLEFFVETLDQGNIPLVTSGDAEDPRLLQVAPGFMSPNWYESWIFWTIAAGAVAAAATTVGIVVSTEQSSVEPTARFGGVQVGLPAGQ